jgi:hypothetical protein
MLSGGSGVDVPWTYRRYHCDTLCRPAQGDPDLPRFPWAAVAEESGAIAMRKAANVHRQPAVTFISTARITARSPFREDRGVVWSAVTHKGHALTMDCEPQDRRSRGDRSRWLRVAASRL